MQTQMQDREASQPDLLRHTSREITGRALSVNMAPAMVPLSWRRRKKTPKMMEPLSTSLVSKYSLMFLEAEVPLQAARNEGVLVNT